MVVGHGGGVAALSSRDGYPLEPKSGLNGVNPPVEFGERTRECSPGHAGKEGPHLEMTGGLGGFTELQRLCWFLRRYDGDLSLPLGLALGSPIFHSGCEGTLGVALESLQG